MQIVKMVFDIDQIIGDWVAAGMLGFNLIYFHSPNPAGVKGIYTTIPAPLEEGLGEGFNC